MKLSPFPAFSSSSCEKLKSLFAGRDGVTVVDTLDDLAESGLTVRESMVLIDRHPNARWHEIVARSLYKAVKKMGLNPGVKGFDESAKAAGVGGAQMKQGLATGLFWGVLAVALLLLTLYMQGDNNLEPASGAGATTQQ